MNAYQQRRSERSSKSQSIWRRKLRLKRREEATDLRRSFPRNVSETDRIRVAGFNVSAISHHCDWECSQFGAICPQRNQIDWRLSIEYLIRGHIPDHLNAFLMRGCRH